MTHDVIIDQGIVGTLDALVGHHFAQRPTRIGLVALRRAVIDADRLLDDRQLFLRQPEDASDFFVRWRATKLFG